jgi:hypothetical protein
MKRTFVLILGLLLAAGLLLAVPAASVRAEDPPPTICDNQCDAFQPVEGCPGGCAPGGGSGGGVIPIPGNEGGETNPGDGGGSSSSQQCGIIEKSYTFTRGGIDGETFCYQWSSAVDSCTGNELYGGITNITYGECQGTSSTYNRKPICDRISYTNGRLTCDSTCFDIELHASVPFPGNCIDLRPYPVSLVNWPSAARYSCASSATGTDFRAYVNFGGGTSVNNPKPGDWRNVRFSLTLYPFGIAYAWLPHVPVLTLPLVNDTAPPVLFKFPYSSHPAAGGGPLAGTIQGFDEAPSDMPVFVGQAAAAYGLRWSLTYEEYQEVWERTCVRGPKNYDRYGRPVYECKTSRNLRYNNGHYEDRLVFSGWVGKSFGGELPAASINAPAALKADLNGDGIPDAIWNRNFVIRRMNDINRIDDPVWRRQWAFGGTIYWGVREGQAQIGWPGSP